MKGPKCKICGAEHWSTEGHALASVSHPAGKSSVPRYAEPRRTAVVEDRIEVATPAQRRIKTAIGASPMKPATKGKRP